MNVKLSRSFSILLVVFGLFSFLNANIDFSYDYSVYLYYNDIASTLDFNYLNASLRQNFPLPYVLLPPATTFEYGYTAITVLLAYLGISAAGAYAIVATTSVAIRAYVLDRAKTGLLLNVLIAIGYITLFEANALRAGLASSIVLVALLLFMSRKYASASAVAFVSAFFHIQSAIYVLTFACGVAIYTLTNNRPYWRAVIIILGTALTFVAVPVISSPFGVKVDDYLLRASEDNNATGLNTISALSLLVIALSLYAIPSVARSARNIYVLAWISSLFAFSQSTIFLIFGSAYADIGVRLWQFAFLVFCVCSALMHSVLDRDSPDAKPFGFALKAVYVCAAVQAVNVLFRYPLSNFFYPLVPYAPIDYIVL